jgi:chemotaxis protein MotB
MRHRACHPTRTRSITDMKHIKFIRPLVLAFGAFLFASCVTQEEHKKALDYVEDYQQQLLDTQSLNARLERDNKQLRHELAISQVNALKASSTDPDLKARVADFERALAELGSNPDAITRIDLDDGAYVYVVPDAVLFASGSAQVSSEGRQALIDQVAAAINAESHGRVWVRGHTDSDRVVKPATLEKFPHGNLQLSVARAIEVAAVLATSGGVPADQIAVAGFGPNEPLVANDSTENKAMNRRVEIYVSPGM